MKNSISKRVATMGLLMALAIALSYLEYMIPTQGILPPGVKLGISNILTMYCLYFWSFKYAASIVIFKSLFSLITRGLTAALIGLAGGIFSILIMGLILLTRKKSSNTFVSIIGAVSHNMGQLIAARCLLGSNVVFAYIPILSISGVVMGSLTAFIYKITKPYLTRLKP
ncbi:MAG: Gx transporter family protein [Ruminococcaceae bacterium]|nr:Gx transporter family protein [Oscillospiraceae bacterium]